MTSRLSIVLLPCALACSSLAPLGQAPALASASGRGRVQSAVRCKKCHEAIYDEWKGSMHARSTPENNPLFSAIYAQSRKDTNEETKLYCIRCHAPVSQINGDVNLERAVTNEGVTCDVCHTMAALSDHPSHWPNVYEPGKVKRSASRDAAPEGHDAAHSELLASAGVCSGCHGDMLDIPGTRSCGNLTICDTDFEWRFTAHAKRGKDCKTCHMTTAEGNVDHGFPGAYSQDTLLGAVSLDLRAKAFGGQVIVSLDVKNEGAAHLVPTGPPARLAFVKVSALDAEGSPLWSNFEKNVVAEDPNGVFHIVFASADGTKPVLPWLATRIVKDTRLRPDETRRLVYKIPAEGVHRVEATLLYRHAPPPLLDRLGVRDEALRKAHPMARADAIVTRRAGAEPARQERR